MYQLRLERQPAASALEADDISAKVLSRTRAGCGRAAENLGDVLSTPCICLLTSRELFGLPLIIGVSTEHFWLLMSELSDSVRYALNSNTGVPYGGTEIKYLYSVTAPRGSQRATLESLADILIDRSNSPRSCRPRTLSISDHACSLMLSPIT